MRRFNSSHVVSIFLIIMMAANAIAQGEASHGPKKRAGEGSALLRPGVVLKQRDGTVETELTVSAAGMRAVQTPRYNKSAAYVAILRSQDERAIVIDTGHRVFTSMQFSDAVSRSERARRVLGDVPKVLPDGLTPPLPPVVKVRELSAGGKVAGLPARSFEIRKGPLLLRVWFATDLPKLPDRMRAGLVKLGSLGGPVDRAMKEHLGDVVLRIELLSPGTAVVAFDTIQATRQQIDDRTFADPQEMREITADEMLNGRPSVRADIFTNPLSPHSLRPVSFLKEAEMVDLPANPIEVDLLGVVVAGPELYNLYWGAFGGKRGRQLRIFLNNATDEMVRNTYGAKLSQYRIGRLPGRRARSSFISDAPPAVVGSTGLAEIEIFLNIQQLVGKAPRYWVLCCGTDPIISTFVIREDVDVSAWGGYHFWVVTEIIWAPLPIRPIVQLGVPWTITKVPRAARNGNSMTQPPARNIATGTLGHEYVEAATDPYPFTGWVDIGKQPMWTRGELADICDGASAFINGFSFAKYFSKSDGACFP